jgi:hypothetical protein
MITLEHLVKLLKEMFQDTFSWLTDEQLRSYHIGVERDLVRHPGQYYLSCFLEILWLFCLNADLGQLHLSCSTTLTVIYQFRLSQFQLSLLAMSPRVTLLPEPVPAP